MLEGHKGDSLSVGMEPAQSTVFRYQMSGDERRGQEKENYKTAWSYNYTS